jgi:hypothetical protein
LGENKRTRRRVEFMDENTKLWLAIGEDKKLRWVVERTRRSAEIMGDEKRLCRCQ